MKTTAQCISFASMQRGLKAALLEFLNDPERPNVGAEILATDIVILMDTWKKMSRKGNVIRVNDKDEKLWVVRPNITEHGNGFINAIVYDTGFKGAWEPDAKCGVCEKPLEWGKRCEECDRLLDFGYAVFTLSHMDRERITKDNVVDKAIVAYARGQRVTKQTILTL
jgi:hypothetical protein